MAGHSYGTMLISGGQVHNGDKVSVVENNIERAIFLTNQDHIDVAELVTKLSSAIQQYDTLRHHLQNFGPRHKDLMSLLSDTQDLQSALSNLQRTIEDPQMEDINTSDECLHPILEVSQSLDEYQSFIEELQINLDVSASDDVLDNRGLTELNQSHNEIRWKLNHLRDKLNSTIIVANIGIQRRLQAQTMQQIQELKALFAVAEMDTEHRLLPSLPTRLPLKRQDLERAKLSNDPDFALRRYLEALALQRPNVSHPSTPSMQGSSISTSSTTGIISFVTARDRQSSAGIDQDACVYTLHVCIRGLPQLDSCVLRVNRDDTIYAVKSKIGERTNFVAEYSLSHHNKLLRDSSKVSDNLINDLATLKIVPDVRTGVHQHILVSTLYESLTRYFEYTTFTALRKFTIQLLKWQIHSSRDIPGAQQVLIWKGERLEDAVFLNTIADHPITLVNPLNLIMEDPDQDRGTSKGSVDQQNRHWYGTRNTKTLANAGSGTSRYGTSSSQSSKRFGRGIRMFNVRQQMKLTA